MKEARNTHEQPADQRERREYLISHLLAERSQTQLQIPRRADAQTRLLRGLLNTRMPAPADDAFLAVQDAYLQEELQKKHITDADSLPEMQPGLCLWQGDITTLRCDAIVNAANSGMTGCYIPCHCCIDNCIHTYAGLQLRLECEALMQQQGYPEPAGRAKLTRAWNLPCRYILHTVGPMVSGALTAQDCTDLAACYRACLELAAENGLRSVAFCCISTGEFHFPAAQAAQIAVQTVRETLQTVHCIRRVIFNVFKDTDRELYEKLLKKG